MKQLFIRPSTVGSWMLCPARPGLRHMPEYNLTPNEPLMFGSAVHWGIEYYLKHGHIPPLKDMVLELFNIFVKDQGVEDPVVFGAFTSTGQRDKLAKDALAAVIEWERGVLPDLPDEVPDVERTVQAVAGYGFIGEQEYEVTVRGTPDAVYEQAHTIVDWKTAGRKWNADKMDGQIQPIFYPWMWDEEFGVGITDFSFIIYDRSAGWWNTMTRKVGSPAAIEAACQTAVHAAIAIESKSLSYTPSGGGFKARGWHCSPQYCDAWGVCEGKHIVNDGRENEPAMTTKERWSA